MNQPMFEAIRASDKDEVIRLLVANPETAHGRNGAGVSPLMQARYEHKSEIVEIIRSAVKNLDIFEAATLGDVGRLRELLRSEPQQALAYSKDGFTALQFACFFGQPEAAELLAHSGSDLNAVSRNTMNVAVINTAAASGNADIVRMVLSAGARPDHQQQAGYTALHEAAAHNNVAMTKVLLDAGADPHIRCDDGNDALSMASGKGHKEVVELLTQAKKVGASPVSS